MDQNDTYWQAVATRDASFDGKFYYGVLTTKVYCTPSCKTRLALRKNVKFFNSSQDAERFGLRACKKCTPNQAKLNIEDVVHSLCRYIAAHKDETISMARIAKKSGYSAAHIQKAFVRIVGSSPKTYQMGLRQNTLKANLKAAGSVTQAIFDTGYGSASRVYEKLAQNIGMTPQQYRKGGEMVDIHYASGETSLGIALIGATQRGICFLQFGDSAEHLLTELHAEFPNSTIQHMPTVSQEQFSHWLATLNAYLEQKQPLQNLPLDIQGTAFQMLVWRYLQTIPNGEIRSYTEVANGIGKPKAVRAVASACAKNKIGILIPCHRVLRGDGALAGFRWGVERKRTLLDLERKVT